MNLKLKHLFFILLCIGLLSEIQAQPKRINPDLVKFFNGSWSGDGQFANGKKISAEASFTLSADSSCLIYIHTDRAPNVYKATSAWGIDKTSGKLVSHVINNFNGHTGFTSDGWHQGKLILTASDTLNNGKGVFYQHFIYEKLNEDQFKMTYGMSRDGINWREGDHLIFVRNAKN
ncbi:MAG TPA: hypothetical protein VK668_21405 [Mucilaginibacter sp.]|nr:hypothetical protein [Mucilaginibacter sp.]